MFKFFIHSWFYVFFLPEFRITDSQHLGFDISYNPFPMTTIDRFDQFAFIFRAKRSMQWKIWIILQWERNVDPFQRFTSVFVTIKGYMRFLEESLQNTRYFRDSVRYRRKTPEKWWKSRKDCSANRPGVILWGNRRDRVTFDCGTIKKGT